LSKSKNIYQNFESEAIVKVFGSEGEKKTRKKRSEKKSHISTLELELKVLHKM
jgi:hypothetical protein